MKILHLVLFSHGPYYDQMYSLLSDYYASCDSVVSYFYTFKPDLCLDYEIHDDILYIKGTESYVPGILDKTVRVFQYFQSSFHQFDYVVRTNISTVTNPFILVEQLSCMPVKHGSTWVNTIGNLHPSAGITDTTWFGTKFSSGSNMIFSIDALRIILTKINYIHTHIVDDVAIGILIKQHCPLLTPELWQPTRFFWTISKEQLLECLPYMYNHKIFYRNRINEHCKDRTPDIENIKLILQWIVNVK